MKWGPYFVTQFFETDMPNHSGVPNQNSQTQSSFLASEKNVNLEICTRRQGEWVWCLQDLITEQLTNVAFG